MNWEIKYLQDYDIAFAKVLNPLSVEDAKQLSIDLRNVASEHDSHKYLIDHRGVDVVMSVSDIQEVPQALREASADFLGKIAILIDPDAPKSERFEIFKNVLAKAWMHFELFSNEQKARDWLKSV